MQDKRKGYNKMKIISEFSMLSTLLCDGGRENWEIHAFGELMVNVSQYGRNRNCQSYKYTFL